MKIEPGKTYKFRLNSGAYYVIATHGIDVYATIIPEGSHQSVRTILDSKSSETIEFTAKVVRVDILSFKYTPENKTAGINSCEIVVTNIGNKKVIEGDE
jgi:hypothetical protein